MIPFNKPYSTDKEIGFIREAALSGHLSGDGHFSKKCNELFRTDWGIYNTFLTPSCTGALEMAAILAGVGPGDEVIVPAYTFVSTALPFARQGATIVFADSRESDPRIDEDKLESLITDRTKVIVPVHYGGMICDMDKIMHLVSGKQIMIIEDAAHSFGSSLNGRPAGTIGHLGCISFHETKMIHCGEGGMLIVNDERLLGRAEIIWEKGTDRCRFRRGEATFYEWKDTGSSYLLSDLNAAFLFAQLQNSGTILERRKKQWELYYSLLKPLQNRGLISLLSNIPSAGFNYYTFYLLTTGKEEKNRLIAYLLKKGIQAVSHYLDLSESSFIKERQYREYQNINCRRYQDTLLRLPLFFDLEDHQIETICDEVKSFYE